MFSKDPRKRVVKELSAKLSLTPQLIDRIYGFQIREARKAIKRVDSLEFSGFFKLVVKKNKV